MASLAVYSVNDPEIGIQRNPARKLLRAQAVDSCWDLRASIIDNATTRAEITSLWVCAGDRRQAWACILSLSAVKGNMVLRLLYEWDLAAFMGETGSLPSVLGKCLSIG
jgi:nuclear transport factor 2 (NTF2) superfamily protein